MPGGGQLAPTDLRSRQPLRVFHDERIDGSGKRGQTSDGYRQTGSHVDGDGGNVDLTCRSRGQLSLVRGVAEQ
jgi:hypothetical protein